MSKGQFEGQNCEKNDTLQIQVGTIVIRHLYVILTRQYVSDFILMIQGHFQGQFEGHICEHMLFIRHKWEEV